MIKGDEPIKAYVLCIGNVNTYEIVKKDISDLPLEAVFVTNVAECIEKAKELITWTILADLNGGGFVALQELKNNPITQFIPVIITFPASRARRKCMS